MAAKLSKLQAMALSKTDLDDSVRDTIKPGTYQIDPFMVRVTPVGEFTVREETKGREEKISATDFAYALASYIDTDLLDVIVRDAIEAKGFRLAPQTLLKAKVDAVLETVTGYGKPGRGAVVGKIKVELIKPESIEAPILQPEAEKFVHGDVKQKA